MRPKPLPDSLKHLMLVKKQLHVLMSDPFSSQEIRLKELYDFIKKDEELGAIFPKQTDFNKFLIEQHEKGILKQIISNVMVESSSSSTYNWTFVQTKEWKKL